MSMIKLYYGPYEAHGIIRHRPQRLHGLVEALTKRNYFVELIQSEHINRLTVDIYGVTIFRCDIRNLLFNVYSDGDVVCLRALDAIDEAAKRIFDDNNVPKFISIDEGMRFIEKKKAYGTADYFQTSRVQLLFEIEHDVKKEEPKEEQVEDGKDVLSSKEISLDSSVRFKKETNVVDSDMSLTEDSDVSSVMSNLITISDLNPDGDKFVIAQRRDDQRDDDISDISPDVNSDLNPDLNSDLNPLLNSDLNQDLNTDLNTNLNTDLNPDLNPDLNNDLKNDLNNDLNPEVKSDQDEHLEATIETPQHEEETVNVENNLIVNAED